MVETPPVLPAPAIKVGGRRLSVSTKHRPSQPQSQPDPTAHADPASEAPEITDYPRPAPPPAANPNANENDTENAPPQRHHQHNTNDDPPRKERTEKKLLGLDARKAEMTRPTRDNPSGKEHGIGMRIRQPSGKVLGV